MYIETLFLVNIHIYIRESKRKTLKHAHLMIRHQLLVVFLHCSPTSSPFFLSDFISWPLPAAGLLLSDYTTPHRPGPPPSASSFYLHSRLSSALTGTSLLSILSSQVPISSSFFPSFLPPNTRPKYNQSFSSPESIKKKN